MAGEPGAQAGSGYPTFAEYFIQLMHSTKVEEVSADEGPGGIRMTLVSWLGGEKILDLYERDWEVKEWTPLLLARALADLKPRVGGEASVVAVGSDFMELSQTRCEFGEPKQGEFRGNLCGVCRSAIMAVARGSGMVDEGSSAVTGCTIAQGCRACDLTISLLKRGPDSHSPP